MLFGKRQWFCFYKKPVSGGIMVSAYTEKGANKKIRKELQKEFGAKDQSDLKKIMGFKND